MKKYNFIGFVVFYATIGLFLSLNKCSAQDLKLAIVLHDAFELDNYRDAYLFKKAEKIYLSELKRDTNSFIVNYNLGSLYSNYALHLGNYLINNKKDLSIWEYEKVNLYRKKLGRRGLGFIQRANRIGKKNKNS